MYTIIKQIAPDTTIIWSPNSSYQKHHVLSALLTSSAPVLASYGYPSGATLADVTSTVDQDALDTNGDGNL